MWRHLMCLTSMLFHNNNNTFFIGKWGAWPLQNLVTMPKSMTEMGSLLNRGEPGLESWIGNSSFISVTWLQFSTLIIQFTQLSSEGFPDDFPFRLVCRVILLYRFHHQVHYVEQHSEICAVSKGDGWFPDSTTAGSTVTERDNTNVFYSSDRYF